MAKKIMASKKIKIHITLNDTKIQTPTQFQIIKCVLTQKYMQLC
jgi:hypothetical protein